MNKQEWLEELQSTRNNRQGLGMYTLDTFDEEVAELLAGYSKAIREKAIEDFAKEIRDWQGDIRDNERDSDKFEFVFERIFEIKDEILSKNKEDVESDLDY